MMNIAHKNENIIAKLEKTNSIGILFSRSAVTNMINVPYEKKTEKEKLLNL